MSFDPARVAPRPRRLALRRCSPRASAGGSWPPATSPTASPPDLREVAGAEITAVGARRLESATAFAEEFGGTPLGSYDELAARDDVDVVYVASPHALHHQQVRMLLESGKPVLCEKSLTLNAGQAEDIVTLAGERELFLMEAMWMACHPLIVLLRERMAAGDFGTPHQLVANLGFRVDAPSTDRLLAPELGGGVLLDMGIYPLTLAHLFLGEPEQVEVVGTLNGPAGGSGVDVDLAIAQRYAGGAVASLQSSMTGHLPAPRPSPSTRVASTSRPASTTRAR